MKKLIFGLIMATFMLGGLCSPLKAENLLSNLKPGSLNIEGMYSFRYKEWVGEFNIKTEKTFWDGWVRGKLGVIPQIGVDKETEGVIGLTVNPLQKWQEKENCPALIKRGIFNCGINFGLIPYLKEDAKFVDIIKKSKGDFLINILSAGWKW